MCSRLVEYLTAVIQKSAMVIPYVDGLMPLIEWGSPPALASHRYRRNSRTDFSTNLAFLEGI